MPISNDKKKTPTSDNTEHAMTLADALAPLQQRERKTKKTPHSDTKTAPPPMTTDDDTKTTFTSVNPRVRKTKKTPHGVDASGHRARAYLDGC